MRPVLARDVIDFFYPHINDRLNIHFTGGEPLLNYQLIKSTVQYGEKKNRILKKEIQYHITTNGSLATHEILNFFNTHHFNLELSFDGLAQDGGRKKGSYLPTLNLIRDIMKYPGIQLCVNSVFTPETVGVLSESLKEISDLGVPRMELSLALNQEWSANTLITLKEELKKCGHFMQTTLEKTGNHPLGFYQRKEEPGIWHCSAGQDQLCISSNGEIWGCPLFYEYFQIRNPEHPDYSKYYFGHWTDVKKNFFTRTEVISENYGFLSTDNFHTRENRCFLCEHVGRCEICPVMSSLNHDSPEYIREDMCRLSQILIRSKEDFFRKKDSRNFMIM